MTIAAAVENLEKNTPGVIYLDTAQYLLITKEAIHCCEDLKAYMRHGVRICLWDGRGSVKEAAKYLDIRHDLPRLKEFHANG